ncbi:MAG: Lacal_2735 family protein [Jejuia sp.]
MTKIGYIETLTENQNELVKQYKVLMERAYNLRQTDAPLSDFSEYEAIRLLDKLNKLIYLYRDNQQTAV